MVGMDARLGGGLVGEAGEGGLKVMEPEGHAELATPAGFETEQQR